jgi:hypothetical protein
VLEEGVGASVLAVGLGMVEDVDKGGAQTGARVGKREESDKVVLKVRRTKAVH